MKKSKEIKRSSKKQQGLTKKQIIITTIVSAIVIVVSILLGMNTTNTTEEREPFLEINNQVESVSFQKRDGFKIERNGDEWTVPDHPEGTDQEMVNQSLAWLGQWTGEQVEVSRRNVGLDFPDLSIIVDYDDHSKRLSIGNDDPTESQVYVEDHDLGEIFLVDRRLVDQVPVNVVDYLDMRIVPWATDRIESIIIDNETSKFHLLADSPYPPEETAVNIGDWFISEPFKHVHNVSYQQSKELTESLENFEMNGIVAEDVTDWSEYGLDSSDFNIEFSNGSDQIKLVIGDEETPENYYAKIEGEDDVFTIPESSLTLFEQTPEDYHDGYVKILAIDKLNQLSIESDTLTVDITIDHLDENTRQFKVNDETIFEDVFREAYTTLAGLESAGPAESAVYQEPEVVITSTLKLEDGEKDVVLELVDYDDEHYAAFIDQESDFLVEKKMVDNMKVAIQIALDY